MTCRIYEYESYGLSIVCKAVCNVHLPSNFNIKSVRPSPLPDINEHGGERVLSRSRDALYGRLPAAAGGGTGAVAALGVEAEGAATECR